MQTVPCFVYLSFYQFPLQVVHDIVGCTTETCYVNTKGRQDAFKTKEAAWIIALFKVLFHKL